MSLRLPTPSKTFIVIFCLAALLLIAVEYYSLLSDSSKHLQQYETESKAFIISCGYNVSRALTDLKVDHALCYKSLLEALKYGRMLHNQEYINFCAMETSGTDIRTKLTQKLSQINLNVRFDLWNGKLLISRTIQPSYPIVIITLFRKHAFRGMAYRAGLKHWLLPFNYWVDTFPKTLIQAPLKNLTFEGRQMPVPNEDAKMLKLLYPYSWWRLVS